MAKQMSRKNKILKDNQQKNLHVKPSSKKYYAIGEKNVSTTIVNDKGKKETVREEKSFVASVSARFRSEAMADFTQWAKVNGLTITYIGAYSM